MAQARQLVTKQQRRPQKLSPAEVRRRLDAMRSPSVEAWLREEWKQYGRYAIPLEELQKRLEKQLGGRTLSGELLKMRAEKDY